MKTPEIYAYKHHRGVCIYFGYTSLCSQTHTLVRYTFDVCVVCVQDFVESSISVVAWRTLYYWKGWEQNICETYGWQGAKGRKTLDTSKIASHRVYEPTCLQHSHRHHIERAKHTLHLHIVQIQQRNSSRCLHHTHYAINHNICNPLPRACVYLRFVCTIRFVLNVDVLVLHTITTASKHQSDNAIHLYYTLLFDPPNHTCHPPNQPTSTANTRTQCAEA